MVGFLHVCRFLMKLLVLFELVKMVCSVSGDELRNHKADGWELHFSMVDGDFKKFEGKWSVKAGQRSYMKIFHQIHQPFVIEKREATGSNPVEQVTPSNDSLLGEQEGLMPKRKQLRLHGRVDIEKAVTCMGGFRKIASLMNLSLAYMH